MTTPIIEIVPDEKALAEAAADRFVELVSATLRYRRVADVALAGGSTPKAMNALLTEPRRRQLIDWSRLRFFFGDERSVGPDDADSNYRMTRETLFEPLGISADHVFRMRGEDDPHAAADAYSAVLRAELGERPRIDVIYLGMGPDGHTASLFPGTIATIDDTKIAVANYVATFSTWRITLTPHVINDATHVVITCGGAGKADALHGVLDGPQLPDTYPIQLVRPLDGELHWLIDAPAASKLQRVPDSARR